jgi:hypothetical protein
MKVEAPPTDPCAALEQHLQARQSQINFDMNDVPELPALKPFPLLHDAVEWLDANVTVLWDEADKTAMQNQRQHQWLARISILCGVGAIVLAILQLALKPSLPSIAGEAGWIEGAIALACVLSVTVGIRAKTDRKWLGRRHRAERLRMLKFGALAHSDLWKGNTVKWQDWIENQIKNLPPLNDYEGMESWSKEDSSETELPAVGHLSVPSETRCALVMYYRYKRLLHQMNYFRIKGEEAKSNWAVKIRHQRELIFFFSIAFVFTHILAEYPALWMQHKSHSEGARDWGLVALWAVVLAAVLPVIAIGVRAWSAAFELCRKARGFEAKKTAMQKASLALGDGTKEIPAILAHMRNNELFLVQEHREWIRLLLDAEWFV